MPAASYNFTIEKGTAFVISFEYKDKVLFASSLVNSIFFCLPNPNILLSDIS